MKFVLLSVLAIVAFASPSKATPRDADGLTPLHLAAGRGDLAEVEKLLNSGADLYSLDSKMGVSILHKAVYSGKSEVVDLLLDKGALIDLQSPSNGNTPLHDAIYFKPGKDTRVIETLLKWKPTASIRNRAGLTVLDSAKLLKDTATVRLIEEYKRARYTESGKDLMFAVKQNNLARVTKLLIRSGLDVNEADEEGFTPLMWSAREGFTPIVEVLLKNGGDPNQTDQWMRANAGHKAAFWGRADALRLLIANHLDLSARGGYNGYTPLHDAVAGGHYEAAKVLIEAGSRKDIKGHDGKTAVDLAAESGDPQIIALLGAQL